jgi:hypothetical protein
MPGPGSPQDLPRDFTAALEEIKAAHVRPEVTLEESPAPQKLAPFAVALSAAVPDGEDELAHGRLILLCDPAAPEAWGGRLRLVTYLRTTLEAEMVVDPLVTEVAWGWLAETLAAHGVPMAAPSGTVTRVQSQSFGELADDEEPEEGLEGELEIRASWSPEGDIGAHLEAWIDVLCTAAGLPPTDPAALPGVVPIPKRGPSRGH